MARTNTAKYGYRPDKIMVLNRTNRPKGGYFPYRTEQIMGIDQTVQSEIWVITKLN